MIGERDLPAALRAVLPDRGGLTREEIENLSVLLRDAISAADLRTGALAKSLDVPRQHVTNAIGGRQMTFDLAVKLAAELGVIDQAEAILAREIQTIEITDATGRQWRIESIDGGLI